MKRLLLLLFLIPNLVISKEIPLIKYKSDEVALCKNNVAAYNFPEVIYQRVAETCNDLEDFAANHGVSFTTFDINQDNKNDYKIIVAGALFAGSYGPLHLIYISNKDGFNLAYDYLAQHIEYDEDKKIFIFYLHGIHCNQSGASPCRREVILDETNSDLVKPI